MERYHVFAVGDNVEWANGEVAAYFIDHIAASLLPTMEFVGGGPFRVLGVEDLDPVKTAETGHPQIVIIETPVGEKKLSGWWLRYLGTPPIWRLLT